MKRTYSAFSALLIALVLLSGCATEDPVDGAGTTAVENTPTGNRRVIRVETVVLQPTTFEDVIQITGTVEAPNDATLSSQSGGTLEMVAPLGRRVNRGDVVARLDNDLIASALNQARAILDARRAEEELADDNFRRQEPLFRDSIISALEFEQVRTQRIQARAQRSQAESAVVQSEKQLENTRVRAPFGGTVEDRFAEQGEQVLPGTQLVRVVNTSTIRVSAGVPERYAADIKVGTGAVVSFQAYGYEARRATVTFASRVIDPSNRTFRIEVDLPNTDGTLKPQMISNLLITRSELTDQLVVPQTALLRDENGSTVFVISRSGEPGGQQVLAERRDVVLGASFGGRTVIKSGLQPGDEVIVVGQTNVTEGDNVEVVDASPSA